MALFKPDPPQPPNPLQTAAAQTGTNVATGVANAFLNNVNQVTPGGNLSYDVTGDYSWQDPSTGETYNIPRFTATQSETPEQAAIRQQSLAAQGNMAGLAVTGSQQLGSVFGESFDPTSSAPNQGHYDWISGQPGASLTFGDVGGPQRSISAQNPVQTTFGDAGDITRSYGPTDNFSADRQRVEEALYGRLNPQLERDRARIEQQLADQGIRYGSPAYTAAMDDYNRQSTDARLAVTQAGGAEQQRMMDMEARRAGFQNAAQQQAYEQAQGRGQFYNAAQEQQFQQGLAQGTFANAAQQQAFGQEQARGAFYNAGAAQRMAHGQSAFNAANAQRNQYLQEQYARRNQPINAITALLSGSQVQAPNFVNTPGSQIATTDVAGLINTNFQQQLANTQMANQNAQQLMGGLFGLGGNIARGAMMSDVRAKDVGHHVGSMAAAGEDGERHELPFYEYSYKDDPAHRRHVGPMAQDVERIDRRAVTTRRGMKYIRPDRVMGSIFRAAA